MEVLHIVFFPLIDAPSLNYSNSMFSLFFLGKKAFFFVSTFMSEEYMDSILDFGRKKMKKFLIYL